MRSKRLIAAIAALTILFAIGCSKQRASNPSVKSNVENSLNQAGLTKITVEEDRDKGVITIKGDVATQDDKTKAEDTARQAAGAYVIANEILVTAGDEGKAEKVAGKTDDAIDDSFKAYIAQNDLGNQHIRASAKNGVLTLTGDVDSPETRTKVENDAAKIAGVTEVVNKLEVKGQKPSRRP